MDEHKLAAELAKLSFSDDGAADPARARAACAYAAQNLGRGAAARVLKKYLALMKAALAKRSACIEHAGELSAESLKILEDKIRARLGKNAEIQIRPNSSLVGGVRVRCADDVFEMSAAAQIDGLKGTFKKS